jgi:hypothetical protein
MRKAKPEGFRWVRSVAAILASLLLLADGNAQEKGKSAGNDAMARLYAGAKKEGFGGRSILGSTRCVATADSHVVL